MATTPTDTPIKSKNTDTVAIRPSAKSQELLLKYFNNAVGYLNNNYNLRANLLEKDLAYARERGRTKSGFRANWSNSYGDARPIRDVTIPIVMPQVETALAYLASVFLTGYPIFPVLSKKDLSDAALQMETLIGEHSIKFAWIPELLLTLRDGLKYNLMAAEVTWENRKSWTINTDGQSVSGQGKAVETYYEGNYIKHLNMYNLILDTRVQNPCEHHIKGEFCGYTEVISRVVLMQLIADLGATSTMNAKEAYESGSSTISNTASTANFYIPEINAYTFDKPGTSAGGSDMNWSTWAGEEAKDGIKYASMYEKTVLYCRVVPNDFDLNVPTRNTVQIWKLIVINRSVIIFCERQTNAHNYLPIIIGQPTEDGLGLQTKSFADNALPMQDAATSLWNSAIESQRRKVFDRIFYDASKINKSDIDSVSSVARIPVKQVAYGQDIRTAIHVEPYRDEGVGTLLQMAQEISTFADQVLGQNKVQQGQFQKGNKTRKEFDTVMSNASSRQQTMALLMEFRFFSPLKEIIKLNILQFQPPTTLTNRNTNSPVKIEPLTIRQNAIEFKLADGILPVDKMINLDAIQEVLQMTAANPALAQEYDIPGMIMYALQQQGASWIQEFKRTPQQQVAVGQNLQANSGVTDANGQPISPTAIPSAAQPNPVAA